MSQTTIDATRAQLNTISRYIKPDTKLKNITIDTYNAFIVAMRSDGIKESTIKLYSACLKKLFRLAYQREYIAVDFFDKIPVNYLRKESKDLDDISNRLITKQEFYTIDYYLSKKEKYKDYRLLFNLLYFAGLRIGEALALCPADFEIQGYNEHQKTRWVDRNTEKVVFQVAIEKTLIKGKGVREGTKNHKSRYVPLPPKFEIMFRNYMQIADIGMEDRLFNWSASGVQSYFPKLCERVGIRKHKLHDFRHTYISNLVASNIPISDIEEFSGDREETILKTYIHATEDYKFRLLDKLQNL